MHFDFIAKIVGAVVAWLVLVYYRIRHPFTWKERFIEKYKKTDTSEETPKGIRRVGGDFTMNDVVNLADVIRSFAFGNFIVPNAKGEYISIKSTKSEVQQ